LKQHAKTVEWAKDDGFVLTEIFKHARDYSVDINKVGALGHSMGGSAALQAAIDDRRVDAAVDMDGSGGVEGLESGAPAPMLFLKSNPNYSDEDLAKLHRTRAQWEAMGKSGPKMFPPLVPGIESKPVYQFSIRDTGHLSYSDAPFLFPNTITRFSSHPLAADRTLKVTMEITRGFFDHYLKGVAWPVPYEKQMPWAEAEFVKLYG
jgi:pimeloyl-ACP methyl ester carboxylesterase